MHEKNTNNKIHIDVTKIPKRVQITLAAATLDMYNRILAEPDGKERLAKKRAELGI